MINRQDWEIRKKQLWSNVNLWKQKMGKQLAAIMLNLYLISSDNHLKKHAKLNVLFRTYQYGRRTNKDKVVLFFQIRLIGRFLGGEFELKGN